MGAPPLCYPARVSWLYEHAAEVIGVVTIALFFIFLLFQ